MNQMQALKVITTKCVKKVPAQLTGIQNTWGEKIFRNEGWVSVLFVLSMPALIWAKYGFYWGGIAGLYWRMIMYLGHWDLTIQCLSNNCACSEGDLMCQLDAEK